MNNLNEFFKQSTTHFDLPSNYEGNHIYIQVSTTYEGKKVGKDFFDENPEKRSLYPSQEEFFETLYFPALRNVKPKHKTHIDITENGVTIVYVPI